MNTNERREEPEWGNVQLSLKEEVLGGYNNTPASGEGRYLIKREASDGKTNRMVWDVACWTNSQGWTVVAGYEGIGYSALILNGSVVSAYRLPSPENESEDSE